MYTEDDIKAFLVSKIGVEEKDVLFNTDIECDLGCCDDDFHELIEDYSQTFSVDMKKYKWYFHTGEEGNNIGGIFFKAPYKRVERIPVTPEMLLQFANTGEWDLQYPDHKLPGYRFDILINIILFIIVISFIIKACIENFL